jgi:molybdopterin synthase sulfur carrier subunit
VQIEVTVPALLADCTGGRRQFPLVAETLADALQRLLEACPRLRPHLYDEAMQLRRHVLVFYNDDNLATITDRSLPLRAGDRLLVLQAVSGG